jgi:endonuclease-8
LPEGDTVHKLAAALRPDLRDRVLTEGRLRAYPGLQLRGRRIADVRAWGKHLFIDFQDGLTLRSHLGMYGSWRRYALGQPWDRPARRASLVLSTDALSLVCFDAAEVEAVTAGGLGERDWQGRLGPDLLGVDPGLSTLPTRARTLLDPSTWLVDVLLEQRIAAGIGNVYKSELLFLHRLAPDLSLAHVSDEDLVALYASARALLRANLGAGPRRTRPPGGGGPALWVYRRGGRPCLICATPILRMTLGRRLRPTYSCPNCQRHPGLVMPLAVDGVAEPGPNGP